MPAPTVLHLPPASAPTEFRIDPAKLLAGNPLQRLWIEHQDTTRQFSTGLWWSEPGAWRVHYTETEYCRLLEGEVELRGDDGSTTVLSAGAEFVVPAGFVGRWTVVHSCLKRFAVFEAAPAPASAA